LSVRLASAGEILGVVTADFRSGRGEARTGTVGDESGQRSTVRSLGWLA
jgi:hypothetical protein